MKNILLFAVILFFGSTSIFAQIFSDNFDSYTSGDYLVSSNPTDWSTWSGSAGGSPEDVKISDVQSASAPNSLHFSSTATNGGPTDIILRFAQVYTSGNFTLSADFYVVSNKGAYFNIQQDHTPGNVWAINCNMVDDGTMEFTDKNDNPLLNTTFPTGQWFNLKLNIDLTTNQWEVLVDNVSKGTFSNIVNSVGILDLFPVNSKGNGQSEFYVDNVSYNQIPAALPPLNGGVTLINSVNGLAGQNQEVSAKIRNLGQNDINSFDITFTYAGGTPVMESVSSVNIASLDYYTYTFSTPLPLVSGSQPLQVKISNINGQGQDDDATDDAKSITISTITPAPDKIVVGEEATGTWCQWCPRGAVFNDMMTEKYEGFWAGIAVHNNDPMTVTTYDNGIGALISGFPSELVDRGTAIDPSGTEAQFIQRIVIPPSASITNGASYDPNTGELNVTLTYDFQNAVSGNWKVACVLTEDSLSGSGQAWSQQNAYSGGASGEMGGFENLPNPVPASLMNYNGVARAINPSFNGSSSLLPSTINAGDSHTVCFTFQLNSAWDPQQMHIIGMLINPSNRIDNGSISTIAEATTNGLGTCDSEASIKQNKVFGTFELYPNPSNGMSYISVNNSTSQNVELTITDLTGKVIAQRSYHFSGKQVLPINTSHFANGTYFVTVKNGNNINRKKLIVR